MRPTLGSPDILSFSPYAERISDGATDEDVEGEDDGCWPNATVARNTDRNAREQDLGIYDI